MTVKIGDIVLFQQATHEMPYNGGDVHPAIVSRVWSNTMVNLHVFPDAGVPFVATSVQHLGVLEPGAQGWYGKE